jgi:hypothetical protein
VVGTTGEAAVCTGRLASAEARTQQVAVAQREKLLRVAK